MPIDFIEESAEAPKIDFVPAVDFVPDPEEEQPPQKTLADFMAEEPAVVQSSPVSGAPLDLGASGIITPQLPQEAPLTGSQESVGDVLREGYLRTETGQTTPESQSKLPVFGQPGTVTRGVSEGLAGFGEAALNRPEEILALVHPATLAAVTARYAPQIAKTFFEDLGKATQGDNEALGRAAVIGLPLIVGGAAGARRIARTAEARVALENWQRSTLERPGVTPEATAPVIVRPTPTEGGPNAIPQRPPTEVPLEESPAPRPQVDAEVRSQGAPEVPQEKVAPASKIEGMGGAVPSEFTPTSQTPTGIKNATVERERAIRGLPPAIQPARRDFGTVWDEAMAKIDREGPGAQDGLIASLKEKPRALTDLEDAMLLHRQIDLQNEYGKATRDLAQAYDDGRLADVEIQKARAGELSDKLLELYNVNKAAGTETGRGLAARRMMANEDFTLAKMETEIRAAKGGKPLSDQERTQLQQTASEFERINRELEAKVAERDKLLAEAQMARSMAEMQTAAIREASRIPPQIQRIIERVRDEVKKGADESRKFLAGAQFSLSPELLYHMARIGADNLLTLGEAGARWTAKMVEDIGERIRPYLDEVLAASQKLLDDTTDRVSGKVEATVKQVAKQTLREPSTPQSKADAAEAKIKERVAAGDLQIRPLVQRLARAFVEAGVTDRNILIDRVHAVLEGITPEWTRRNTMDAISGYGDIKLLRKDEVSVRLRDLKGQMQQIAKLEDMAAKQAPKKTGLERRTPSDVERELIRQVNEAKKRGGYETVDPETQLKSALDTVKTRMRNEIKELERRIKQKDFAKKERRGIGVDQQALDLEHKREQLKHDYHWMLLEKKLAEQNIAQKTYRIGQEIANVWRAIRTSIDFSAVLRQGKFIAISHPLRAAKAIPDMFRAFRSDKEAFRIDREILARPNAKSGLYDRAGLYLSERGVPLSKMEEAYMSRWAESIPLVAGSARAYSTFLNKLRADSFDTLVNTLGRNGQVTLPEAKTIANFINVATGRGNIGIGNQVAVGLNTLFFAPRYVASRFQMLLGQPLYHGILSGKVKPAEAARARKLIAQEYGRILAGYATIYTLAALAGMKVGTDPLSSDFGKFVIGDTRVDPLAGLSQATVFLSRVGSGTRTTLSGEEVPLRGEKSRSSVDDVVMKFLRTKLAPLPGTALDILNQKDVVGQPIPTDPMEFLLRYVGPISMQDIKDTMEEQGVPAGVALQILNMFGEGVQTYEDRKE